MNFEGTLRFDLFKLQEEQKRFAFCKASPFKVRMKFIEPQFNWKDITNRPCTWYRRASKGSVIWLACADLLVQFEVVSGSCNTRTLLFNAFKGHVTMADNFMPYEPSFCAEP